MTSTDWLVLSEGDRPTRVVPIIGRLLVGRTCAGADASPHLLLDNPAVSRDHFELRVDRPMASCSSIAARTERASTDARSNATSRSR